MFKKLLYSLVLCGASSVLAVPVAQIDDVRVGENSGNAEIKVTLNESSTDTVNVTWVTSSLEDGATPGADYTSIESLQTLTFQPGAIEQTIRVPILPDGEVELDENFEVVLVGSSNATLGRQIGQVTIIGDDLQALPWDPGTSDTGSVVTTGTTDSNSTTYLSITTQAAINGAWRSLMRVTSGEADMYLAKGFLPSSTDNDFASDRIGNDGFVVRGIDFDPGQTWYLAVEAKAAGASWEIVTGDVYVEDLGILQYTDANANNAYDQGEEILPSGSSEKPIGPEGARFYRGAVPAGTPAWALYTPGRSGDILVNKGGVPASVRTTDYQRRRAGAILLVPPYLGEGAEAYFIGIEGAEGDLVTLDSRIHNVETIDFGESLASEALGDFPFTTYRVEVPDDSFAWDIALSPLTGNPDVAVRRGDVGSEIQNDGFSEVLALAADSVTVAPPALGEGAWYITVYSSEGEASYGLSNGEATITTRPFAGVTTNDQTSRVGWRYYVVPDIASQQGSLGWQLSIEGAPTGTELALRKNAVPSVRRTRTSTDTRSGTLRIETDVDFDSDTGLLQRARHQADVWYIGVFSPDEELGEFILTTGEIAPLPLVADGGNLLVEGQIRDEWRYFRVDITDGFLGWDVELLDGGAKNLRLAVSRNLLPDGLSTDGFDPRIPANNSSWPSGATWFGGLDWTGRSQLDDSSGLRDRRLVSAMGKPLSVGTYYVGVLYTSSNDPTSYNLRSRMIGDASSGSSIVVEDIDPSSSTTINALESKGVRYFKVSPDADAAAWKLALSTTVGESMIAVRKGFIPDFTGSTRGDVEEAGGTFSRLEGNDVYHLLARQDETGLGAGDFYVAVVSEGVDPTSVSRYGVGESSATLTSSVPAPSIDLGILGTEEIRRSFTIAEEDMVLMQLDAAVGTRAFDLRFEDVSGEAAFAIIAEPNYPGFEEINPLNNLDGGWTPTREGDAAGAIAGISGETVSISLKATANTDLVMVITPRFEIPVAFNNGTSSISGQIAGTWRFFEVVIPESGDYVGWDIRLKDVSSGDPKLVIGKGRFPTELESTRGFPGSSESWGDGQNWTIEDDWSIQRWLGDATLNSQRMVMAIGSPLDPGTYYVGVSNEGEDTPAASYTIESRAIGLVGSDAAHIVQDVSFDGDGNSAALSVPHGDIAFARCPVPEDKNAWNVRLGSDLKGTLLAVRKGFVPDFRALDRGDAATTGGISVDGLQNEWYSLLHTRGETATGDSSPIMGDYYYMAVMNAEAPNVDGSPVGVATTSLESKGEPVLKDLGGVSDAESISERVELETGQLKHYEFEVPEGIARLVIGYRNAENASFAFSFKSNLSGYLKPVPTSYVYGYDGGVTGTAIADGFTSVFISDPLPGTYSVTIRGDVTEGLTGSCDLFVESVGLRTLDFNGGSDTVFGQGGFDWRFYQVEVPETGFLGWDIELLDDQGGAPQIVVRKGVPPGSNSTGGWNRTPSENGSWPDNASWRQISDFTGRTSDPEVSGRGGIRFTAAFGQPLEPGLYVVGVYNNTRNDVANYSIVSRGVGLPESDALVKVNTLTSGTPVIVERDSRRTQYFKTTVPPGAASFRLRLENILGESMLAVRRDFMPDCDCTPAGDAGEKGGVSIARDGDEWYTLLPPEGEEVLEGGDYFIAVTSEGQNPPARTTAGTGISRAMVSVAEPLSPIDLGTVGTTPVIQNYSLTGGEIGSFRLELPEGIETLEVRMENRVNTPEIAAAPGTQIASPGATDRFVHGFDGGVEAVRRGVQILSLVAPPAGPLMLTTSTGGTVPTILPASAQLQVSSVAATQIAFGEGLSGPLPNTDSGSLIDSQIRVYNVDVPATLPGGGEILGWKLRISPSIGSTIVRVYPNFESRDNSPEFLGRTAVIAKPYFSAGRSWRFEVEGVGLTNYTVTSEPVILEEDPWAMSTMSNEDIGDSGEGLPGDKGRDLGAGDWDFYAIDVPEGNAGVLRTVVEAINGVPHLFIRENDIPATEHGVDGKARLARDLLYSRSLEGNETLYGNWVPFDSKVDSELNPGRYFIGIFAAEDSNARYRFQATTGDIQPLAEDGSLSGQQLFRTDWSYYRFETPATLPDEVFVNVTRNGGEITLHLRDTIPPGLGSVGVFDERFEGNVLNEDDDKKNEGPYLAKGWTSPEPLVLTSPPLRPATTYYIGARAINDANFDISLSFGPVTIDPIREIAFDAGVFNETLEPGEVATFLVRVPASGAVFEYTTVKEEGVVVRVEQGAYPGTSAFGGHANDRGRVNRGLREVLDGDWPWLPDATYFFSVTNDTDIAQPVLLTMSELQDDGDELPDAWELENFGNLNQRGSDDFNGDGITDFLSYALNIDPVSGLFAAGESPLPEYVIAPDADTGGVVFTLASPRSDVRYTIEKSSTLRGSWSRVAVKEGVADWDLTTVATENGITLVPDGQPVGAGSARFYRLKATKITP